ncbi:MAG: GTP-binding protein [Chthoniobacteraceae bacterium]|nr:GTP-binding protein [Chthoniobacteraceae bacterium]
MIQKKICMIGTSGVGKTSLVARFVSSIFSDKYLTTVGVKIDKKVLTVDGTDVTLVLWDLAGDDDFQRLQLSYLRGTAGYILVADGTRQITLDQLLDIQARVREAVGPVPFVLALNKADLQAQWEIGKERIEQLTAEGWHILLTSAKTGAGVEEAFSDLSRMLLAPKP